MTALLNHDGDILLAATDDDVLHQISAKTFELLSETNLQDPGYPTLNAISIAAYNNRNFTVMGKDGWYAMVAAGAAQPFVTQYLKARLGVHAIKQGPYYYVATGGYKSNNGLEVILTGLGTQRNTDAEGAEVCRLIYIISYHNSRVTAYGFIPKEYFGPILAGEIQDKKAHAEIMVSNAPINICAVTGKQFLLTAGYVSNQIDIIDISHIDDICVSIFRSPCPPEHGYFGVAHTAATRVHPQTVLYNAAQNKAFVLSESYVETFSFDAVAKTLTKISEFPHGMSIAPIYGVNQMAVSTDGKRSFVLGNGIIRVFDNKAGEQLDDIAYGNYTCLLIV